MPSAKSQIYGLNKVNVNMRTHLSKFKKKKKNLSQPIEI